jgi:hypothetical protein
MLLCGERLVKASPGEEDALVFAEPVPPRDEPPLEPEPFDMDAAEIEMHVAHLFQVVLWDEADEAEAVVACGRWAALGAAKSDEQLLAVVRKEIRDVEGVDEIWPLELLDAISEPEEQAPPKPAARSAAKLTRRHVGWWNIAPLPAGKKRARKAAVKYTDDEPGLCLELARRKRAR